MSKPHTKTLILPAADIEQIVRIIGLDKIMDQLIERLHDAFLNFDPNTTEIPIRSGFHYQLPEQGLVEWMPLHQQGKQVIVKMVGYHPNNPEKYQLPTIVSTISSYDTRTGHLQALVDGVFLTALRTGAASAVASRLFASKEVKILGLIGCGAQSVTQLHALSRIFDFEEVLFYDVDQQANDTFIDRVAMLNLNTNFQFTEMDSLVSQSDIICTATSIEIGEGPLFQNLPTKGHLHVNALGSDFPGKTELPLDLLEQSLVCPDFRDQAIREGECQQLPIDQIGADIFSIIRDEQQFNKLAAQRTVFDSTGLPLEDFVVMELFLDYAKTLGLGVEMEIENTPLDAKNPYHFLRISQPMAKSLKTN